MCRLVVVLCVFAAGVWLGRVWEEHRALAEPAAAGSPYATLNGDTNGDGMRDITDAVHLLLWLFASGPEPATIVPPDRFTDNGDGTINDSQTGLVWLQRPVDVSGDGQLDMSDYVGYEAAIEAARSLNVGGRVGWDLPNTSEAISLVHCPSNDRAMCPLSNTPGGHCVWIGSTNGGDPCHGANLILAPGGWVELGSGAFVLPVLKQ